jgi:hypothetical protein
MIWSIALEIKAELVSLRNALRSGELPLNGPPDKKNPPNPLKEITPPLSPTFVPIGTSHRNLDFDRWWEGYPEKTGKGAAKRAFVKALTKTSIDQLMVGVERYKATKPVDRPWCNPTTWLNQERWLDVPASTSTATGDLSFHAGPNGPAPTLEELRLSMERPH